MRITKLWKDNQSGVTQCPAIYETDDGRYVVQGTKLDPETRAQLNQLGCNEDAVVVPANVLDRLQDH